MTALLNAPAWLIAHLARFFHISSFITKQLHWLPFITHIEFKLLLLVLESQLCSAPKYLCDHIRPLSLLHLFVLSVPAIPMIFLFLVLGQLWPKTRSFESIGASLLSSLSPSLHSSILSLCLYLILTLTFFHGAVIHWERLCLTYAMRGAI